jgi:hypothetical protein
VDGHLHVHPLRHVQATVDGRRRGAPVLVQLQAHGPGADLLLQGLGQAGVALAQEAQVHRQPLCRLEHAPDVPGSRCTGGGVGPGRRPRAPAQHGGDPGHQGLLHLLGADEVDMGVDGTGGEDLPLPGDGLGARPHQDVHAGLGVRIAGLADAADPPVLDAHVGLDDAPVVQDQGIGDDDVHHLDGRALALAHTVTDDLAAAELDLVTVVGAVLLDLDEELRVT